MNKEEPQEVNPEEMYEQPENLKDYRNMLGEEITKLRNGQTDPSSVNAITNATGKVISLCKLQLDAAKHSGERYKNDGFMLPAAEQDENE